MFRGLLLPFFSGGAGAVGVDPSNAATFGVVLSSVAFGESGALLLIPMTLPRTSLTLE